MPDYHDLKTTFRGSSNGRNTPTKAEQTRILKLQHNCCFYCGLEFGDWFVYKFAVAIKLTWDHFVPYSYGFNNAADNFVASCTQCNAIKSDKIFPTIKELVDYVRNKRQARNLPMRTLWGDENTKQELAEVLFSEVSDRLILGPAPDSLEAAQRVLDDIKTFRRLQSNLKRKLSKAKARRAEKTREGVD